jgi:hypothetical protein
MTNPWSNKKNSYLRFNFLALMVLSVMAYAADSVSWTGIKKGYAAYCEFPSGENADGVIKLLPTAPAAPATYAGDNQKTQTLDFIYSNLAMLQRQVISRDPYAVKLAFSLKTIADGGLAEELDVVLGQLIRIDPTLFLRQLSQSRSGIIRLDSLVGNLGEIYVDNSKAQMLEVSRRIEALQQVSDPQLVTTRDKCIKDA